MSRRARGYAIHRARRGARLTQLELSRATNVGLRTIGRIESGEGASEDALQACEYFLGLIREQPAEYEGQPHSSTPRDLAAYSNAELLAELLRREKERDRP